MEATTFTDDAQRSNLTAPPLQAFLNGEPAELSPDFEAMKGHLEFLFGDMPESYSDGLIEIAWTTVANGTHKPNLAHQYGLDQIEAAAGQAFLMNSRGSNVYYGVWLRKPGTFPGARAKDEDCYATTSVCCDLDDEGRAENAQNVWGDLPPSRAVMTGKVPHARMQFYYLLKEPLTDPNLYRRTEEALCGAFDGDPAITNPGRVMRLPGSIAHPTKPLRVPELTYVQKLKRFSGAVDITEIQDNYSQFYKASLIAAPVSDKPNLIGGATAMVSGEGALGIGRLTDGREKYMRDTVLACLRDCLEQGVTATPQQLFDVAWPQYDRNCCSVVPGKPDRGTTEMMAMCVKTVARYGTGNISSLPVGGAVAPRQGEVDLLPDPGPFSAADFKGTPPPREWVVKDWIPAGTVTLLSGDGGTGKSLLALQLMYAAATGTNWFGIPVPKLRSLGVFCEDKYDELHRRHADVAAAAGYTFGNPYDDAIIWPRNGCENLLATYDKGKPERTPFFVRLSEEIIGRRTELLILDTLADTFGGNEIIRAEANHFIKAICGGLIRTASGHGVVLTVLLLGHPSQAGKGNGSGESGSTAWNNSVRSRLYLTKLLQGGQPNERVLTRMKANYASAGPDQSINLIWHDGVLGTPFNKGGDDERLAIDSAKNHIRSAVNTAFESGNPYKGKATREGRKLDQCMLAELGSRGIASHVINAALGELIGSGAIVNRRGHGTSGWALPKEAGHTTHH